MTSPAERHMDQLLAQFVDSFDKLDEMEEYPFIDPIAGAFAVGQPAESEMVVWRPRKTEPELALLEFLHSKLSARFPPLFERLLLTYRWAEVNLDRYTLMANPTEPSLESFFQQISGDLVYGRH